MNVLYCHAPDMKTPLEEQAAGLNAMYKKGLFTKVSEHNEPLWCSSSKAVRLKYLARCVELPAGYG